MKSLKNKILESMERKYHLSYDAIESENPEEDRQFILEVLEELGVTNVASPCKSTIVFTYPNLNFKIVTFSNMVKDKFYFSLCAVAKTDNKIIEKLHPSKKIKNEILQNLWNHIKIKGKN